MADFFTEYFLNPINSHSGYNPVNTAVYAILGLLAAYLIYLGIKRWKIEIGREFALAVVAFVLFGSTMRVVSDSVDTGVMQKYVLDNAGGAIASVYSAVLNSHLYDYKVVSTPLDIVLALHSPGIYFVTGFLFLLTVGICAWQKKLHLAKYIGFLLFIPHFLLLVPMMRYLAYGLVILVLALLAYFASGFAFRKLGLGKGASEMFSLPSVAVSAHAIDGAATFTVIDLFNKFEPACRELGKCYFEQHVLSNQIGQVFAFTGFGFFLFFLVKASFAAVAAYFVWKEAKDERERNYIFLLLIVFGLAPGLRDLLRMVTGA